MVDSSDYYGRITNQYYRPKLLTVIYFIPVSGSFIFVIPIMVLRLNKILLLLSLLVIVNQLPALAQASFTATISPGSIGKDETAELRLMINNARQVEQIIPPSLQEFIILSGPNQESGMESSNGVTRQYIGITYILQPKKKGRFTIGSAIAKADGKNLRSKTLTLVVNNSTGNNTNPNASTPGGIPGFYDPVGQSAYKDYILKKGENLYDKINKNIFIKVEVDKNTCFVGEPVVVVYKLFTRLKSESSIIKNPAFNGFSVIDLLPPGNTYYSIEKLNGREYNVYTLRKAQLYPLQAGVVELESAEVENNIHFIKQAYINGQGDALENMFRDFNQTSIPAEGIQDEKVTLQSKPVLITVKPLPEKDQPLLFKGAVGSFVIAATLEKNSFTTDDAGKLNIAITGQGNMPMVLAPEIEWPEGIEPYETQIKEQLDQLAVPISGTKNFEYPFTAGKPGTYNLPAINFVFFDVKQGKYKKVSADPFSIVVTKGTGKNPVTLNGQKEKSSEAQFFDTLFSNRWLIIIPLAILIFAGMFVWLQKDKKSHLPIPKINKAETDTKTPDLLNTNEIVKLKVNPFIQAEEKMVRQDGTGFYDALNREIRKFLSDKLQIPLESMNDRNIMEGADKMGVALPAILQIQQLLNDLEWQLYTPSASVDKMEEMYNKADAIVHDLNATIP